MALAAVMTQTLLPRAGGGLVPAAELLDGQLRRAPAHPPERAAAPAPGNDDHAEGRFASRFEESLAQLVKHGLVERQEAMARAVHVEELEQLLI